MRLVYGAILLPLHFLLVAGFRRGAPDTRCLSMKTGHGQKVLADSDPSPPYQVLLSQQTALPGTKITVTIKATRPGVTFKGFFAQAVGNNNIKVGTFETGPSPGTKNNCKGVGITHTSNDLKTEISATWVAPLQINTTTVVNINATVVANYSIYWYGVQSAAIRLDPPPPPPRDIQVPTGLDPMPGSGTDRRTTLQGQVNSWDWVDPRFFLPDFFLRQDVFRPRFRG